jgi:V8-like Glu-specific endopeptidase
VSRIIGVRPTSSAILHGTATVSSNRSIDGGASPGVGSAAASASRPPGAHAFGFGRDSRYDIPLLLKLGACIRRRHGSIAVGVCVGTLIVAANAAAGTRPRPQIVGGQPVPPGMLTQLAYVQDKVSPSSYIGCTGTVVSSNLVLTAGHCAQDDATGAVRPVSGFLVATGRPDLANQGAGQVSAVSRVVVYPGYDRASHDGDAALLQLSTPTSVPAMQLANSGQSALWQPGTTVAIAGWGLTSGSAGASAPTHVQWATTHTQSPIVCTADALLAGTTFDPNGQLCAADAPTYQTGTCLGDSGGPMIADYASADPVEVGITSWGVSIVGNSCDVGFPSFFTQTAPIAAWVSAWAKALAPPAPPAPGPSPKPKPIPAPVASAVPKPEAGSYSGTSSQHRRVRLRVTAARDTVGTLKIAYRLRCRGGRHSLGAVTFRHFAIGNLTFGGRVQSRNETYAVSGTFDTTGHVRGTMKTSWHSARYGTCRSGTLRFAARRFAARR